MYVNGKGVDVHVTSKFLWSPVSSFSSQAFLDTFGTPDQFPTLAERRLCLRPPQIFQDRNPCASRQCNWPLTYYAQSISEGLRLVSGSRSVARHKEEALAEQVIPSIPLKPLFYRTRISSVICHTIGYSGARLRKHMPKLPPVIKSLRQWNSKTVMDTRHTRVPMSWERPNITRFFHASSNLRSTYVAPMALSVGKSNFTGCISTPLRHIRPDSFSMSLPPIPASSCPSHRCHSWGPNSVL